MTSIDRLRIILTLLVTLAVWSLLVWQHSPGVPAHHLLQGPDLPRLSDCGGVACCRPECLIGLVLGMSTFLGTILPTLFGSLVALVT